jgi:hypothetical protein
MQSLTSNDTHADRDIFFVNLCGLSGDAAIGLLGLLCAGVVQISRC